MTKPTAGAATPKTRAGKPAREERERDHGLSDHDGGVSVPTKRERPGNALATIGRLSRDDLVRHWASAHGRPPPKGVSRRLLEFAAAYHLQSKAMGGLKPGTRRTLLRVAAARKEIEAPASPALENITRHRHRRLQNHSQEIFTLSYVVTLDSILIAVQSMTNLEGTRWRTP